MEDLGNPHPKFSDRIQQEWSCPMRGCKPEAGVRQRNPCDAQLRWVLVG